VSNVRRVLAAARASRATVLMAAVTCAAAVVTGCGSSGNSSPKSSTGTIAGSTATTKVKHSGIKIAFVELFDEPDAQGVAEGVQAAAARYGASVTVTGPPEPDPTQEVADFQNVVAAGAKGVIVQANPPSQFERPIETAIKQGVDVESDLLPTDGSGTKYLVGPSIAGAGAGVAQLFASKWGAHAHGTAYVGVCETGLPQFVDGFDAFKAALAKLEPGVTTQMVATAASDQSNFAAWQRIIAQHPSALGYWGECTQDLTSLIKLKQESPTSKWLNATEGGESPLASPAIQKGYLTGATSSRDFVTGYVAATLMLQHLISGKAEPTGWINTGFDVMSKANSVAVAKTNASASYAAHYYKHLIASLLANPTATEPQAGALTKLDAPDPSIDGAG
jgi:ABC-type sugar transport system substrate-binding protein